MKPRVFAAVPILGEPHPEFNRTLLACLSCPDYDLDVSAVYRNPKLTEARAQLLGQFLERDGYTHFLELDADLSFHPSVLTGLLNRKVPFVGAPYAFKATDGSKAGQGVGRGLEGATEADGLVEVQYVGGGCILLETGALLDLCLAHPELEHWTHPECGHRRTFALWSDLLYPQPEWGGKPELLTDDYALCQRWRDFGGQVYLDLYPELIHWDGETPYRVKEAA